MVMSVQFLSLSYQELLHTQLIPRLGPLEWIFTTPSHHAVHHGLNDAYIDKNFGGVLIVWDRLFGTYAERNEAVRFGINETFRSHNPLVIAFHEWWAMAVGVVGSRSLRQLGVVVFGRPSENETVPDAKYVGDRPGRRVGGCQKLRSSPTQ